MYNEELFNKLREPVVDCLVQLKQLLEDKIGLDETGKYLFELKISKDEKLILEACI